MNLCKKLIAYLIILALGVSMSSVAANVAEAEQGEYNPDDTIMSTDGQYRYYILKDETVCIERYKGTDSDVTVPSEIDGRTVSTIGYESFWGRDSLKSVTIPDTVTTIESFSFVDDKNLEKVEIPDTVTQIGSFAFGYTKWLDEQRKENPFVVINGILIDGQTLEGDITLPKNIVCIGDEAFYDNDAITSVVVPDSVVKIETCAFEKCDVLTEVKMTDSVQEIGGYAFAQCDSLETMTIPGSVKKINDGLFEYCSSLKNVVLEEGVTSIGYEAFGECYKLEWVKIPDSVSWIDDQAFGDSVDARIEQIVIVTPEKSYAESYAKRIGLKWSREIPVKNTTTPTPGNTTSTEENKTTQGNTTESNGKTNHKTAKTVKKVQIISVKNIKTKRIKIVWKKAKGAKTYEVQYATKKSFKNAKRIKQRKTSCSIARLKKKKTYYIRVRGYYLSRSKKIYGQWSKVKKIKIKK